MAPDVLAKASRRGYEYAWRLSDVPEVLVEARRVGLAVLGGQIQFRIPEGTCELYWHSVDSTQSRPNEAWADYVGRCADEVTAGIRKLPSIEELIVDGARSFGVLGSLHSNGIDLADSLYLVLTFDAEPT